MERICFKDYDELVIDVVDKFDKIKGTDYDDVAIIAKYNDAKEIIKRLICAGFNIHSIDIHEEDWEGCCNEYIISLTNIFEENEVWCEPMLRENGYIYDCSCFIYILDNCSSKVIPYCDGEVMYEVSINDEYECGDCCGCCDCDCYEEDMGGMITSTASYMVNGEMVTREVFEQYEKAFSERLAKIEREISDFKRNIFFW